MSQAALAARTSDRWPSCRAPMVGTRPELLPAARAPRAAARISSTVLAILIEFFPGRLLREPPLEYVAAFIDPWRVGLRPQGPFALEHGFERLTRLLRQMVGLVVGWILAGHHVAAERFGGIADQLRGIAVLADKLGRGTKA